VGTRSTNPPLAVQVGQELEVVSRLYQARRLGARGGNPLLAPARGGHRQGAKELEVEIHV
jgi:hypothetical protein